MCTDLGHLREGNQQERKEGEEVKEGGKKRGKKKGVKTEKENNKDLPIQRNWNCTQPCTNTSTQRRTPNSIRWTTGTPYFTPRGTINAVDVDQTESREDRHVCRTEHGVCNVCGNRCTEKDKENAENRSSEAEG